MPRLLFEKKGNAVWISHLDLMRLFQRAFKRAGFPLKHTQGFNPRPSVSIALPLSVGTQSNCELLDFEIEGERVSCETITQQLNNSLVAGIRVLETYETGRKIRDLSLLRCQVMMEYDKPLAPDAQKKIEDLFNRESLFIPKKTKSGIQDQDIIPMIRRLNLQRIDDNVLQIDALICYQNPTLNPTQLVTAICMNLPELTPDFSRYSRVEIYDNNEVIFR